MINDDIWTTQNGEEIYFNDLEDSHLLNILNFIERKADEGITIIIGEGYDLDDYWHGTEKLKGDEVKEYLQYSELKKIACKRGLIK